MLTDLKTLAAIPELWLVAAIVFCGYQVFWATYSFSAYLHEGNFGLSATAAGFITTLKLWMRPVGGIGGGFLGDRVSKVSVLFWALVLAALSLVGMIAAPAHSPQAMLVVLVLFIGILTYAIRGLYWSLLDDCKVPTHCAGLAIGLISVLGYSPDVFVPLINGYVTQTYRARTATSSISAISRPSRFAARAPPRSSSTASIASRSPHEDRFARNPYRRRAATACRRDVLDLREAEDGRRHRRRRRDLFGDVRPEAMAPIIDDVFERHLLNRDPHHVERLFRRRIRAASRSAPISR